MAGKIHRFVGVTLMPPRNDGFAMAIRVDVQRNAHSEVAVSA